MRLFNALILALIAAVLGTAAFIIVLPVDLAQRFIWAGLLFPLFWPLLIFLSYWPQRPLTPVLLCGGLSMLSVGILVLG